MAFCACWTDGKDGIMTLLVTAILLLLLSGGLAPPGRRGGGFFAGLAAFTGIGGAVLGLIATFYCLSRPETATLAHPWPAIEGLFLLKVDPLSALFLFPLFLITGAGQLYGLGYRHVAASWINSFYPPLAAGMVLLLTAGNGVIFLIGWEIMALTGYLLVVTERYDEEVQKAGFIYLAATHTGTLALFGMFALLGGPACLVQLPAVGSLAASDGTMIFLLALFGFGFKAGIMPLHIWLPRAHAAAPSQVSALMSGVMIKTGIYGLFRIIFLFREIPSWWGWLILALGLVSGIMGVVLAIAQHDLKRLLAYHSVENIGIILIGLGAGLLGVSHGLSGLALLGLAGALLHVVNHGLFKALLFLSGGAVIRATHTRELSAYGGLFKAMPLTGFFFLGGAVAICGLPPLNGFVSEWLIYLGLFQGGLDVAGLPGLLPAVAGLALIGGLALLCFTKVFGLCFLGAARPEHRALAEAPGLMLGAMAILLAACFGIGLAPMAVMPMLSAATAQLIMAQPAGPELAALAPAAYLSLGALLLILLLGLLLLVEWRRRRTCPPMPRLGTWGCGFASPLPRARYTPSSFAEMIVQLCHWSLRTRQKGEPSAGLFPFRATFSTHTPDLVLDLLVMPVAAGLAAMAAGLRRLVQHGVLGTYLLYSALALSVLLSYALYLQT
jgi:hydrogenase-4 component B